MPWFYYNWSQKKNSSLDRGLRYRGSTVINSIFVGIRIFQHLNLLLVCFDPISLMRRKPQNAYLNKTALSPRFFSAFSNQQGYVAFATTRNNLFDEGSRLSGLKFINMTLLNDDSISLTVLNCYKERTAKFAPLQPPPPPLKVHGHSPPHVKNRSPGPLGGFNSKNASFQKYLTMEKKKKQEEKPTEHNQGWPSMMNIISTG